MTPTEYFWIFCIAALWLGTAFLVYITLFVHFVAMIPAVLAGVVAWVSTDGFIHRYDPPSAAHLRATAFEAGEVQEVARSPDGVVLWRVKRDGQVVYFSSAKTQWETTRSCGTVKVPSTCTDRHEVLNAQ